MTTETASRKYLLARIAATARAWLRKRPPDADDGVAANRAVLPILVRQLETASQDMETEVSAVCRSFHGMARKAVDSVQDASRVLDADGGESEIAKVVRGCRETMVSLLDRMERAEQLTRGAIQRMERIESSVAQVGRALEELDASALANRIVALNAKIEAVHLGAAGRGFEVVAEEISAQAQHSNQLTCQVAEVLATLMEDARHAMSELRGVTAADHEWVEASRQDVQFLLTSMETANEQLRQSLQASTNRSRELADDIEQALVTLQFQDRVSQRIQHVTQSLEKLYQGVSDPSGTAAPSPAMVQHLESSYTMDCERAVHAEHGAVPPQKGEDPDIELF